MIYFEADDIRIRLEKHIHQVEKYGLVVCAKALDIILWILEKHWSIHKRITKSGFMYLEMTLVAEWSRDGLEGETAARKSIAQFLHWV